MTTQASGAISWLDLFTEFNGPIYEGVKSQNNVESRWWVGHPLDSSLVPGLPQDGPLSASDMYSKTRYGYDKDRFNNVFISTLDNGEMAVELKDDFFDYSITTNGPTDPVPNQPNFAFPTYGYESDFTLGPSNQRVSQGRYAIFTFQYKSLYTSGKIIMSITVPTGSFFGTEVNPSLLSRFNTNGASGANFTNYWNLGNVRFYDNDTETNLLNANMSTPMDSVFGGRNFQISFRILAEEPLILTTNDANPIILKVTETATGQTDHERALGIYYGFD